jgi:hypothetical protein
MISNSEALKRLKLLWMLWEKQHPDDWPSSFNATFFEDYGNSMYGFFKQNLKFIGADASDMDTYFFYLNLMIDNEDNLYDKTINESNIVVPEKKTFNIVVEYNMVGRILEEREGKESGYFTEQQFEESYYHLKFEDYIDPYNWREKSINYSDIDESDDIVRSIEEVSSSVNEEKLLQSLKKLPRTQLQQIQETINKIL